MSLPRLETNEPEFSIDTAALGRIDVLPLTIGRMAFLENIEQDNPRSFINKLLITLGRQSDSTNLTDKDLASLSNEEMNDFSRMFLENNQYLYRKEVRKEDSDEEGRIVVSFSDGAVQHQKNKNESYSDYLFRLFKIQQAEWKEQTRRLMAPFNDTLKANKEIFTPSFVKTLKKSLSATERLGNIIERLRTKTPDILEIEAATSARDLLDGVEPTRSKQTIAELGAIHNPVHDTNERLSDIVNRLDTMETLALQMAETVRLGSDTASQFLVDFGAYSKKSYETSRRAFVIAILAVIVGISSPISHIVYSEMETEHVETSTAAAINAISSGIEIIAAMQQENFERMLEGANTSNSDVKESVNRLSRTIEILTDSLQPKDGSLVVPDTDGVPEASD